MEHNNELALVDLEKYKTVEEAVLSHLKEMIGGIRGGLEAALPMASFAFTFVLSEQLYFSLGVGGATAILLLAARLLQRSTIQYIRTGLILITLGAVLASTTGGAENVFLPGIVFALGMASVCLISVVVGWPLFGFIIGEVLGNTKAMRYDTGVMKLSRRLTLIMMTPPAIRGSVELPLYLAGEVGWLGVTTLVLGWPLGAVAFAVATLVLFRGRTPLEIQAKIKPEEKSESESP